VRATQQQQQQQQQHDDDDDTLSSYKTLKTDLKWDR
jgi:hypothetical protein